MLSGRDVELVGMWDGSAAVCRHCAVKRYGVLYVELLEHKLREPPEGMVIRWGHESMCRYAADEAAVERGFEEATEYHAECEYAGCEAVERADGEWYCECCAMTCCEDCGKRLDWSLGDQHAAEYAAAERGEDLRVWL
jgi:hypothetical protein